MSVLHFFPVKTPSLEAGLAVCTDITECEKPRGPPGRLPEPGYLNGPRQPPEKRPLEEEEEKDLESASPSRERGRGRRTTGGTEMPAWITVLYGPQ